MGKPSEESFGKRAEKWIVRFVKFNIIGFSVFLVGTGIFALAFSTFGAWTWMIASGSGGILQFALISILNTTNKGQIFESCEERKRQKNENKVNQNI